MSVGPLRLNVYESRLFIVVFTTIVASTLVFSFKLTSFLHAKDAALALGLAAAGMLALAHYRTPAAGLQAYLPLWAMLGWAVGIEMVSPRPHVPAYTIAEGVRLASLLLVAGFAYPLLRDERYRERVLDALCATATLVAALGLLQYMRLIDFLLPPFPEYDQPMYSVFGNQGLFGGYVAMAIPLAVARVFQPEVRRLWMVPALPILLVALLLSGSRSAWLAGSVGMAVVLPYRTLDRKNLVGLGLIVAAVALTAVFLAPEGTVGKLRRTFGDSDTGGRARLWFWDATARMIADYPVQGVGLGNYPYRSPYYHGAALHAPGGERHFHNQLHTEHAHNDFLEIQAELGVIGTLCLLWMAWRLRPGRGAAWGGLAALIVFAGFNATYTSAPHALAGLLLAGALVAQGGIGEERPKTARGLLDPVWAGVAALALAAFTGWAVVTPSYLLRSAEDAYRQGGEPAPKFEAAANHRWPNYEAKEAAGIFLWNAGEAELARRALLSAAQGLDTGRIHWMLAISAEAVGDQEAARRGFEACLWRWPDFFGAWEAFLDHVSDAEYMNYREEAARWLAAEDLKRLFGEALDGAGQKTSDR